MAEGLGGEKAGRTLEVRCLTLRVPEAEATCEPEWKRVNILIRMMGIMVCSLSVSTGCVGDTSDRTDPVLPVSETTVT